MTNLTILLPSIVGVLYLVTSIAHLVKHNWCFAGVWGGYAIAQLFLVMLSIKELK